ncbi:Poly-beta-hydroxybutyrate polymerase domain protein [Sterolibacterium denitrificans]|uniref:Poly-beta-hydroxybutyrate polymerase domain protein n=2 Tax=Sterolibacterium denitrificans TaxID=157592 RepID=A0A7Z7MVQ1_9PROT|nr:Poly-beta-hydroxybutyrate polymerase domain protein [Sterolibacterium denitrificans]
MSLSDSTVQKSTPMTPKDAWQAVHDAVESRIDPIGMMAPLVHAQMAWWLHPQELAESLSRFSTDVLTLQWHTWQRALGMQAEDVVRPHADDQRFSDPEWRDIATWGILRQWYLLFTRQTLDMLHETPGLSSRERRKAAFWWREWLNAMAPTNFFWSNPVAQRKAIESNGQSLARGLEIMLDDLKAGTVRMTDPSHFTVGKNLATTPGKVVFRNRLLEVIHYTPTVEKNFEKPLVIVTAWINKHYILDMTPAKSMVKYLLDQGFSVFITSWKNPDQTMSEVSFDDYLSEGIDKIIHVAREISGAKQVNAVGYCIGGAALTTYMAWANRRYSAREMPVSSVTLLTALVDYHKPGDIEIFLDESTIQWLSKNMQAKGFLEGQEMATAFRLLRSNSLIWHYVVHGYLYGETPPPFDVLYWNMDATRMPADMHQWYLREFYLNNNLIKKDALTIAGEAIDLERIKQPVYSVGAADDHIAPWRQTFRVNNFVCGSKRNVLSSSGHILGIVNPPVNPPKREYWVGTAERHDTPESWHERAEHRQGSWWEDWMAWLKPQAGKLVKAGPTTTREYPALGDAPGEYVRET